VPFNDAYLVVEKVRNQTETQIAKLGKQRYVGLLEHAMIFVEYQFGERIPGRTSYENDKDDRLDNW
jgi:hypothetical protein